ncbi:hypothetical protein L210DRAFT_2456969 [Boletus edulis BED1]|uniref:AIG1-type G domain-containing protein n=1 Tax=Boletus edulis BED1 TaxID=1328754 RepID=A0AAD4BPQ7_BOLED|nr:hypothetical protein L210DRAFT_2456969 [Boletus edulis BED1]
MSNSMSSSVMGPTGSGKSTFVSLASGHDMGISHTLTSCARGVLAVRFRDQESGQDVVMVDTPGLNDTIKSDDEILNMISDWLTASSKRANLLSGILYMHRITDNRTTRPPLERLRKLCGDDVADKVYLTTTMWDEVEQSTGESILEELKTEYWNPMMGQGARVVKCQKNENSAKRIIQEIVIQEAARKAVLLQKEMADVRKQLRETEAVQELHSQLEDLVKKQRVVLQRIDIQRQAPLEGSSLEVLWREYNDLRVQVDGKLRRVKELRLSWLEYLFRVFSRK